MAKTVSFPLYLGRKDSVDPKLAPLGVLGTCRNLRVRKDGRLTSRNGYEALSMLNGPVVGYDLHQYQGRLLLLGSNELHGYPSNLFEYVGTGVGSSRWRTELSLPELTPFVGLREVSVAPPPSSGVDTADCATTEGYICAVTRSVNGTVFATVLRESDGQAIASQDLTASWLADNVRVAANAGYFFLASQRADNSIDVLSFHIGTDTSFQRLVNQAFASSATVATYDIVAVENRTTAAFVIARDRGTTSTLVIRVYDFDGAAVGSDITLAATDTTAISLAADQTTNRIHLGIIVSGGGGSLYTYNFSTGALLLGPTATTSGTGITICRHPDNNGVGTAAQVMTLVTTSAGNASLQTWSESAHGATATRTIYSVVPTTRMVPWPSTTQQAAFDLYSVVFAGYISPVISSTDDATNAVFYVGHSATKGAHMATRDYVRALPRTQRNNGLHVDTTTGRVVWCCLRDSGSGSAQIAVTTMERRSTARRQAAAFGSLLYLAGAPMQVYDGRYLTEPFQEVPGIVSATPSNSSGTLTNSATYTYTVHWELTLADGSFWASAPSAPFAVTMGASDDTVTLVVSTPHHSAIAYIGSSYGPEITAVISRTVYDSTNGLEGSVFRRAVTDNCPGDYGQTLTIVDTVPDSTLATQEALYTQSDRGPLSGCLEHNAARACQFIAAAEARLYTAGSLVPSHFQVSKEAFLGEPFTFSEFSSFFGQVSSNIRGLFSLDGARLVFTADDIFAVGGDGPDDLGGGYLESPIRIPTPSGLEDWRSFLEVPDGLFFQLDDGKLYLMPRGGGAPVWDGIDIQDTLSSYPVITGACKSRRDDCAVFAAQNTSAGTDGRLLVRSLRTGLWMEDSPPLTSSEGIEALTSYGDTIAYLSGGAVYVQSSSSYADGTSTVIPTVWKTQPLYPFGPGGYGLIHDVMVLGEHLSAGTLALRVSYDDGVSFTSLASYSLTGLTAGATVRRRWALPQVGANSIVLEWTYTPTTAGAGLILNVATLLVTQDEGLPELLPSEAA